MSRKVKYHLEQLAVGESLLIRNPPEAVRGTLYKRARRLGIRVTVVADALGANVLRVA